MPVSPTSSARPRAVDRALDQDRADRSADRNRAQAAKLPPSHGDPPRSARTPNTGNGRVRR
jgi:hypothetical protein